MLVIFEYSFDVVIIIAHSAFFKDSLIESVYSIFSPSTNFVLEIAFKSCAIIFAPFFNNNSINFIDIESQDAFYNHRRLAIETKTQQTCELTLVKKDKSKFLARLESKAVFDDKGEFIQLNTNIIDIGKPT